MRVRSEIAGFVVYEGGWPELQKLRTQENIVKKVLAEFNLPPTALLILDTYPAITTKVKARIAEEYRKAGVQ